MFKHLAVMVAWHDMGWNGRICRNPKENVYCESFNWVKSTKYGWDWANKKRTEKCENCAGKKIEEIQNPPCGIEKELFSTGRLWGAFYGVTKGKEDEITEMLELVKGGYALVHIRENPIAEDKIIAACLKIKEISNISSDSKKNKINVSFDLKVDFENPIFVIPYQELYLYFKEKGRDY